MECGRVPSRAATEEDGVTRDKAMVRRYGIAVGEVASAHPSAECWRQLRLGVSGLAVGIQDHHQIGKATPDPTAFGKFAPTTRPREFGEVAPAQRAETFILRELDEPAFGDAVLAVAGDRPNTTARLAGAEGAGRGPRQSATEHWLREPDAKVLKPCCK